MASLTLTAKNQLTLKKEVVAHLGLKPGDKVEVDLKPGGRVELSAPQLRTGKISDIFGTIKPVPEEPQLTIEDMNAIIAQGWASAGSRGL